MLNYLNGFTGKKHPGISPGTQAPLDVCAGEEGTYPAPGKRPRRVNPSHNPAPARDGREAPEDGQEASRLRGTSRTSYGGTNRGREREEEKRKRRRGAEEKRERKEPGARGGAERREAAGRELTAAGAGGGRGQVREPPTAAGRRPPAGRGAQLGSAPRQRPPGPMVPRRDPAPASRLRKAPAERRGAAEPAGSRLA